MELTWATSLFGKELEGGCHVMVGNEEDSRHSSDGTLLLQINEYKRAPLTILMSEGLSF